jgi:hypothetical protein
MAFKNEAKNEKDVEKYFNQEVAKLGGKSYKWVSVNNRAVPDRIVFLPEGLLKIVEFKAPGKRPTPLQEKVHKYMRSLGHEVFVVDSKFKVDIVIENWREEIEFRSNL